MYSTKLVDTVQKNDVAFIDAGIHENVKLTNLRIDETKTGSPFLELTFEDSEGKQLKQTEFEPMRYPGNDDTAWERTIAIKVSRLMDYVYLYYPKNTLHNEAETYGEFIKWVANLLEAANKNVPLRIKAVYNQNGFVTLPRYNDKTFIERMDVEKTSIVKVARDVFERPAATESNTNTTSGRSAFASATKIDELPF